MKKLRIGVIGAGYLGKFHAEKYSRMDNVTLVGVVDTDFERATQVAQNVGTIPFSDYRQLFGKVDAVSVVVPTPLHFKITHDFLGQDADVLIEKPMTTTLDEADELIAFAESRGLIIQVGHLERFNPAIKPVKHIVKKPMFIESHRLSVYQPRGTDVSVVLDLMIHDIDIILNLVRADVRRIHAAGISVISGEVDIANARLEFETGCVANVTASRISMKSERKIRLFQKDAYISLDFANHGITVVRPDKKARQDTMIPGMHIENLSFDKGDALDDELKSFVRSVRHREAPEVTGQVGRDALNVALSIMDQIDITSAQIG